MERDVSEWFTLPWNDGRYAAGLAADLIHLLLPPAPRTTFHSDGPYRGTVQAEQEDVVEDDESREAILHVIKFVEAYRDGALDQWDLSGFEGPDQLSRAYDAATHYSCLAQMTVCEFLRVLAEHEGARIDRWYNAGACTIHAVRIVQKWAANSTASGYAFNHFVEQITRTAIDFEPEKVPMVVQRWRYRDAVHGGAHDETHRVAFSKAWELGSYELAYKLMVSA